MATARVRGELAAGCLLLLLAGATTVSAAPTVAQMLSFKPKQDGIACTTPSEEDQKGCTVKLVTGARKGSSGWLLLDPDGKPLRRYFDTNGDKKIDVWSYYQNGLEVYREIDTAGVGAPNQYRWLNQGGSKWGVDFNRDGTIDSWKTISAAEACQELFAALAGNNLDRFKALLITEAEIRSLGLPAAEANNIRDRLNKATAKFQAVAAKMPARAQWGGLEDTAPHCVPSDTLGADQDLLRFPSRSIRFDAGDKHDWLQTGEMIRVGTAWRLVEGPTPGDASPDEKKEEVKSVADPVLQGLLKKLADLDAKAPQPPATPGPNAEVYRYNTDRAELVEQIAGKVKKEEREQWLRQLADGLGTAAQNAPEKDKSAQERLGRLRVQIVKDAPATSLAAYVTFREMWATYGPDLAKGGAGLPKLQAQWLDLLKKFVQDFPTADDTPDALLQLAMGSEFNGKDGEAKKYYQELAKLESSSLAAKAKGALRRLDLVGNEMTLSGPTLGGGTFDLTQHRGKVIVVYFWASYCQLSPSDFVKLKQVLAAHGAKGVELVCVNLDEKQDDAVRFLKDVSVSAVHLYQPGGLNSPLATQYGIMGLPSLILIGKDHKVVSRTVQINDLDDEVGKLLK
jgi:thiol-disulfide isomerase/thioredoxin